jgi:hypothetical protein
MRSLVIFTILFIYACTAVPKARTKQDCPALKKHLKFTVGEVRVDYFLREIELDKFERLTNYFYQKIMHGETLKRAEDIQVIMIMNTSCWSTFDKTEKLLVEIKP